MEKWEKLKIPFSDIKDATKNFQKIIGRGGYGSVYEGKLLINGEYIKVAVKRLNEKDGQGLKEFLTEIDLLSGKQHENLITLVGYCDEENEKIIVYEFADRGSLDFYFRFRNSNFGLTWLERLNIVVDAARGLDHLHNRLQKNQVIIHRDIKSSNILLNHNLVAKISDFGLSKSTFSGLDRSMVISNACGTLGYVEPELSQTGIATKKTDVYSFGMVLFEILCGRLCNYKYDDGITLSATVVREYYYKGDIEKIIDPLISEQMSRNAFRKFLAIAIDCLKVREQRPLMDVVKKELEETLTLQVIHSTPTDSMSGTNLLRIPFAAIKDATKDFKNLIGKGDYGFVYSGELSVNGVYTKVTVKRSYEDFGQEFKEFLTEIQLLSSKQHENIITLVGYCDEGKEKIIVYEFAEHGSLDQYIRCSNMNYTLTWLERLKIVVDVARGLDHLHNPLGKYEQVIIHADIKASNILLDDKWTAKISDTGLSRLIVFNRTFYTLIPEHAQPTYVDQEYTENGTLTEKSDVYSFGVVLFEVLCGRLCNVKYEDDVILTSEIAKEYYAKGNLEMIIDPILREQMSQDSLRKFSAIAYKCLQNREERPLMDVVKKELEKTLNIEVLRWGNFICRHWSILNVGGLSPHNDSLMLHEKAKRLKSLSITCEEDDEYVELANRFEHYIRRSDRQMHYNNNKELYLYLCEGFLCDNGQLWVSLCKSSNGICSMLPATQVLRDDIAYHHLYTLCLSESRFRMVRILGDESSYNFTCTLESQIFSPANMYACYLVFKFEDNKHPDDTLMFTTEYGLGHGLLGKVLVHMSEFSKNKPIVKPKTDDQDPRTKGLDTKHELQYDLECWMHPRKDGWIEAMLSKPLNRLQDHSTLEVRLIVLNGNFRGVIVEGIEFRPYV